MALQSIRKEGSSGFCCDLDSLRPESVKTLAKPSQPEWATFATEACDHVQKRLAEEQESAHCLITLTWDAAAEDLCQLLRVDPDQYRHGGRR